MARGLAAEGAEVNVFSVKNEGELDIEAIGGVVVHRSKAINLTTPLRISGALSLRLAPQSYGCLKDNPPDVIHAFGTSFSSLVAAGVSRMLKHPLVTTLQPGTPSEQPLRRRVTALAYQRSLGRVIIGASDRVICSSPTGVVQAAKFGARSERTVVQPYAAEASELVRQTLDVYVDALAERELRWFLQHQAA
jgi:hypothetical protein